MSNIVILSEIKEMISNRFELLRYNWSRSQEPEIFWQLRLRLQLAKTGSKIGGSGGFGSGSATLEF